MLCSCRPRQLLLLFLLLKGPRLLLLLLLRDCSRCCVWNASQRLSCC